MVKPIQITVGGGGTNPAAGATVWSDPSLAGQDGWLSKADYGPLKYSDYTVNNTGGVTLLNGLEFGAGEIYFWYSNGLAYQTASANYTNGYNYASVINALFGRLAWRQPTPSGAPTLNSNNTTTRSGRYFDDFHALVTAMNVKNTVQDPELSESNFNTYLESLQKSAIMRALNGTLNVKELIDQPNLVFNRIGDNDEEIANNDKFVGYRIEVAKDGKIAVQIESATLLFNQDITLPLYLFKDGKQSAVWSDSVSVTAYEATVVNFSDLVLNYISGSTKGHIFYFGYFQSDLGTAKAMREQVECWNKTLCFSAYPFSAKTAGVNNFNRDDVSLTDVTFGINLEISSFYDQTNVIVKKPALFDELIGLNMAYVVLEQVLYSTRSNATERILKDQVQQFGLQMDMNGVAPISDSPQTTGLKQRIERETKRVKEAIYPKPKAQTVSLC